MRYALYRESDGAGDSGPMCQILDYNEGGHPVPDETRPRVGFGVRVGSEYARSYAAQDWWQCTPVVEILDESETTMRFKTRSGSIYKWAVY